MAGSPRVQLSLKGRLLSEVAFVGPQLRIGRMRENDVVVNNLAVSRFHAVLKREGDGFVLEDLGSENGTQLNGQPITGSVPMKSTDVIQLGKYELRLSQQPNVAIAGPPKPKASDAWDASQTFLALDPASAKPGAAAPAAAPQTAAVDDATSGPSLRAVKPLSTPSPLSATAALASVPAPAAHAALALPETEALELEAEPTRSADSLPDPDESFAFGEEEVAPLADASGLDAEILVPSAEVAVPNPEHTSLFDFGSPAEAEAVASADEPDEIAAEFGEVAAPGPAVSAPTAPHAPRAAAGKLHAGVIVQRDGKLHLLRAWEAGELCAGRAAECDIVLADAGVSRRHAIFSCSGGRYSVRDLGSVNGIYVNGKRTQQHELAVGDVVRIESFELTFVLDHSPIGSEVSGPAAVQTKPQETGRATQFSLEAPARENAEAFDLAPLPPDALVDAQSVDLGAPGELEDPGDDGFEILAPADDASIGEAGTTEPTAGLELPESDLISAEGIDDDEEKEAAVQGSAGARALHAAAIEARGAGVSLRLALDPAQLSPRAREALAALAEEGVLLTARISVDRE